MRAKTLIESKGFTLIEIVLAMGILAILAGSIIGITRSTLELTTSLASEQKKQIRVSLFEQYLQNCFSQTSRDSRYRLVMDETSKLQTLTITSPNQFFPLAGNDTLSQRSSLIINFNREGILQLTQGHHSAAIKDLQENVAPDLEILLLDHLVQAEWEFYNQSTREWLPYWQTSMGQPAQVKFHYKREFDEATTTLLIWIPRN